MTDGRNIIPAGPGFVGTIISPNEYSADVELELIYGPDHETVASLLLRAVDVEAPQGRVVVGVELTKGDLLRIVDWATSMIIAAAEDE